MTSQRLFLFSPLILSALFSQTSVAEKDQPNILWLTCEDNNVNWVGCYGNPHANTPNIDRLASEGFRYLHAFANAPVCAPQRSTWITGIHSLSMGTHPMRSRYKIPHDKIKYYPDHLKANGYFVGNSTKTDYNIGGRDDKSCWDNPDQVKWNQLKNQQPFFQIVNSTLSHESKAFGDVNNTTHDPANTKLRKYHPDLPDIRKNYAHYHDAMKRMDDHIGKSLQALEKAGLADNTIVIYNSDHGGVLPRSKRYLFSTGIHCPLIIRIPEKYKHLWPNEKPGTTVEHIISFVDMPKTWLSITGSEVPEVMQGNIFLGKETEKEREYHFAFRARMDERNENARAVYNKRYLYIRNYMPYTPWMQRLEYLWRMKATQAWVSHVDSGKASEVEARFFNPKEWTEEFYDREKDPDSVNNLINDPAHAATVAAMRKGLRSWQEKIHDSALLPESDMVKRAAKHNTTIYELVRDPKLYDLPSLLDAADLALAKDKKNLPALEKYLQSHDSGLRYWGMIGCFLLDHQEAANRHLDDDSHEVRAMAAWLLIKTGEKDKGFNCLDNLLKEQSYSTLKILNILAWIGEDAQRLLPTVEKLDVKNYEAALQEYLVPKWGGNLSEN